MPKKKTNEEVEEMVEEVQSKRLDYDFGRADLNDMRDAINELFQR